MPLKKNQVIPLTINALSNDGNGIGRFDGQAVFVPFTAVGDELSVKIVKVCKSYAFGIIDTMIQKGPERIPTDCPIFGKCGGCCFRHISYKGELQEKQRFVADAMKRIGGIDFPVDAILPSPQIDRYRNKVQYPLFTASDGKIHAGFYAARSHRVIPCNDCLLQPKLLNQIAKSFCQLLMRFHISTYDEATHCGLVRHLYLRHAVTTGRVMVCIVCNGKALPHAESICKELTTQYPEIESIVLNVNTQKTNVITGSACITLYGTGVLHDAMCNVPVALSPLSFYQVNTQGANQLYKMAAEYAQLKPEDTLLDLYCGAGTIGLSMANQCKRLIGVEIIPQAIESAKRNADKMGVSHAEFFCADAGIAAQKLAQKGLLPDVVILDPPRKGCDMPTLDAVVQMSPRRIVMVSCNPATAARDAAYLSNQGYQIEKIRPVDLFPRTKHVETVVQLSQRKPDDVIRVGLDLDELDITSAESKVTYPELKDYILKKYGFKVSSLYIAQVKRKLGLDVGTSFNRPKSEDAKQPQCPPEKEEAITEALKHFGMI